MAERGVPLLAAWMALALLAANASANDTAPPPRFRDMQVTDLPPVAPLTPPPPAAAPTPDSPVTPPPATGTAGFWVQLGAFRERDAADGLLAQAARGAPGLAPRFRVFSDADAHRVHAGPFATREAAVGAATQVRESLRIAPVVVERR